MVKSHKIKIYSSENCIWCTRAKDFFKQNKIKFEEVDVNKDRKAAMEMVRKSGQTGIPVLEIDGKIIIGFDINKIKQLLGVK